MSFRFQADADLHADIVRGLRLRESSIDFQEAAGTIQDGTPDPEVPRIAAEAGRVLVSGDVSTMPGHFADFVAAHDSPGFILVPSRRSIGEVIEGLLAVWLDLPPNALRNPARWLPRQKYISFYLPMLRSSPPGTSGIPFPVRLRIVLQNEILADW